MTRRDVARLDCAIICDDAVLITERSELGAVREICGAAVLRTARGAAGGAGLKSCGTGAVAVLLLQARQGV